MKPTAASPVVVICPGNGCSNIRESNWYGRLHRELTRKGVRCVCEDFPDPLRARRDRWVPHIRSLAVREENTSPEKIVLVGHSSGAQAALRYAELYPIEACVLVSATYGDLGDANERASGYYPQRDPGRTDGTETNPYEFSKMVANCPTWHQFHSDDDPFIPVSEAEKIRDGLGLSDTYRLLPGRSHFFDFQPELLDTVLSVL